MQLHDVFRIAQRVAGLHLVHLADGADVAAADLLGFLALLALHHIQAAQLLGVSGSRVIQGHIACHLAAQHFNHGILAVLVGNRLENDGRSGTVGINFQFDGVAVVIQRLLGGHISRNRHQIADRLHQHLHAQSCCGRTAQHRADASVAHTGLQSSGNLVVRQLHRVEELLHQFLVCTGSRLHQFGAQGLCLIRRIGRDGALGDLAALHFIRLVVQQIHDGSNLLAAVDNRHHNGGNGLAKLPLQCIQAGSVVAVFLIGAVDENHTGLLAQHFPAALHAHGQAVLCSTHQHRTLAGADGRQSLAGEIKVSGSVHDIDLDVFILDRRKGQRNRNLTLDFLGIVIADGVSVHSLAKAVGSLGHEEHLLGQSRLAGATVTQQADVANVIGSHIQFSPFVCCGRAFRRVHGSI